VIPPNRSLRIVGDVHGDAKGFAAALQTDRFVIQLGDLVDDGPDSAATLRQAFRLRDEGNGLCLLGNHDWKLYRAVSGRDVRLTPALSTTLAQLDADLRAQILQRIPQAPAWLRHGARVFVHGGFHTAMLTQPPPIPFTRPEGPAARALYGEPTGRTQPDGYPERSLAWLDRIPSGITVICGHDIRSTNGRPLTLTGTQGGIAIFLDTGAGKGGHLSWLDLESL
jgi:protein phosphatase